MDEDRALILNMLAEGKIDHSHAVELLKAISEPAETEAPAATRAVSEPAALFTKAQPAAALAGSHKSGVTEREYGDSLADQIGTMVDEVVSRSVDKSVEIASSIAEIVGARARQSAQALKQRMKHLGRMNKHVRRLSRLEKTACTCTGTRDQDCSTAGTIDLGRWQKQLASVLSLAARSAGDVTSDVEDAVESVMEAAEELAGVLEEMKSAILETRDQGPEQIVDSLESAAEHATEAKSHFEDVEQAVKDLESSVSELPSALDLREAVTRAIASWPVASQGLKTWVDSIEAGYKKARKHLAEIASELVEMSKGISV